MLTLNALRKYNRIQATAAHFVFSLIIFVILGYLVYFCWYPQPLFSIDAGWQGIRILAFVDLVLGPCLTLVIFNPKKKELLKDVLVIALIQFSALSYGVYHVYQSRPAIIVYADNQFQTVALSQLEFHNLPEHIEQEIPFLSPKFYILDIPRDNIINIKTAEFTNENLDTLIELYDHQRKVLTESTARKTAYFLIPERLLDYKQNLNIIKTYTVSQQDLIPQEELDEQDQNIKYKDAEDFLNSHKHSFAITTIRGRFGRALVSIDDQGNLRDFLEGKYTNHWLSNH